CLRECEHRYQTHAECEGGYSAENRSFQLQPPAYRAMLCSVGSPLGRSFNNSRALSGIALAYLLTGGFRWRPGLITKNTLPATKRSVTARTIMYGIVGSVPCVLSVCEYTPGGVAQQGESWAELTGSCR